MNRKALWYAGFSIALAAFGISLFPLLTEQPLAAFAHLSLLLAVLPVVFYFIADCDRKRAGQIAGVASCLFWIAGIALAFVVPPHSRYIAVPDALLLLGFFPLLFFWRFSWTWIIFGLLNFGIGILLMVIEYSPDTMFPADLLVPKHHLADYHPAVVWYSTGIIATIFGVARLGKNLYGMMVRRARPQSTESTEQ